MSKLSFRDTAELIGLAAIVASLIFVGMELQQSQRIAIADQYQVRLDVNLRFMESVDERFFLITASRARDRLLALDMPEGARRNLSEMEPADLGFSLTQLRKVVFIFDNNHYQYQNGFMDEEAWQSIRARFIASVGNSWIVRFILLDNPETWRASFIEEIREIYEELDAGS